MKLWHSFIKELKLSSRGFYFYVELFMAIILLVVLLFVIPKEFVSKSSEYLYFDLPEAMVNQYKEEILKEDLDGKAELVEIKSKKDTIKAEFYESSDTKLYVVKNKAQLIQLAETERPLVGAVISLNDEGKVHYEYYLQGYESERLKNLYRIIHNTDLNLIKDEIDKQEVRSLSTGYGQLNDRENVIPSFLTFNGSLMGLFIIAAYIFLDKKEGIIKAYAVTSSSVWQYLMSKVGVIITTTILSSLIIVIPVMGLKVNYLALLILLITSAFFASSLGLLVASFYKNMMQSFGAIYVLMIAMLLPNIAYFVPSWEPLWIKFIPTYPLIQGFKECIVENGDISYTLMASFGFLVVGLLLFILSNIRYKKTLTA
ncbi:ABC transporter permease [Oceanirhabdus sp. W0125-5]|uniref:ABC transporter permease n=1 Tax=Oceanirhabdus sp. W0125-5 TaxID=2999116 RepID=UPI0022F3375D|nr:ABC transporter permease [Oceanirhabdus sp. W0125-5]WBW95637.1 ABC transporter permease [Oceanirhabdus sp. W0125-5]